MKNFFKGLGNACLNGAIAATSGLLYNWAAATTQTGEFAPLAGKGLGALAAGGALLGLFNYLKKSPQETE